MQEISDLITRWRSAYSGGQKYIYGFDANDGNAEIQIAYNAILTNLSHDATELHRLSGLKDVTSITKNGSGDLIALPYNYPVPIGKTQHKTLLVFFFKNEAGLKAVSINLTADYATLLRGKERLILFDAVAFLHISKVINNLNKPADVLLSDTKCLLPDRYIENQLNR